MTKRPRCRDRSPVRSALPGSCSRSLRINTPAGPSRGRIPANVGRSGQVIVPAYYGIRTPPLQTTRNRKLSAHCLQSCPADVRPHPPCRPPCTPPRKARGPRRRGGSSRVRAGHETKRATAFTIALPFRGALPVSSRSPRKSMLSGSDGRIAARSAESRQVVELQHYMTMGRARCGLPNQEIGAYTRLLFSEVPTRRGQAPNYEAVGRVTVMVVIESRRSKRRSRYALPPSSMHWYRGPFPWGAVSPYSE